MLILKCGKKTKQDKLQKSETAPAKAEIIAMRPNMQLSGGVAPVSLKKKNYTLS